jgi:hypothetical protein
MISQDQRCEEENVARLIRAACGSHVRPTPSARQRALQMLLANTRARSTQADFPDLVVSLLGVAWMVTAVWLGARTVAGDLSLWANPGLLPVAVLLVLNVAVVPAAGIVIWKGRQNG